VKPEYFPLVALAGAALLFCGTIGGNINIFGIDIGGLRRWQRGLLAGIGLLLVAIAVIPLVRPLTPAASNQDAIGTDRPQPALTSSDPPSLTSPRAAPPDTANEQPPADRPTGRQPNLPPTPQPRGPQPPGTPPSDDRPTTSLPSPTAHITSPPSGYATTATKMPVDAQSPTSEPGWTWYFVVQPGNQTSSYYFYLAATSPSGRLTADIGLGPPGTRGIGTYHVHLAAVDQAGAEAIQREQQSNTTYYNEHGMWLPDHTCVADTIDIRRTG
jgi:hypothetical protein